METFQRRFMYFRYRPLSMKSCSTNLLTGHRQKKTKKKINKQSSKQAIKQDKIIKNRPYH